MSGPTPRRWNPEEIVKDYVLRDEVVKLNVSRSFKSWLADQTIWLLIAVTVFLVFATVGSDVSIGLGLLVLVGAGGFLTWDWLRKRFTRYVITDMRVLRITGVLNRQMEFIPWGKITDVSRSESFMQWILGTATIRIESANEHSAFRAMTDVQDPAVFYRVLVQMVDLKQGRVEHHHHVR
ncbi:PH domain-containing protein [Dermatobacter hominis]|uniref:PH domain-containing protein n=1 Tax=Dermatobacter hominis TaxID=2884263 RepID=UPI001D0FAB44|nr:PH domain-containing protein [Dermatobacter hominis]UDY37330.1 PH domain-containing protein [Dermatobacter hominis]